MAIRSVLAWCLLSAALSAFIVTLCLSRKSRQSVTSRSLNELPEADLLKDVTDEYRATIHFMPSSATYDVVYDQSVAHLKTDDNRRLGKVKCPIVIFTAGFIKGDIYQRLHENRLEYAKRHNICYINMTPPEETSSDFPYRVMRNFTKFAALWRLLEFHLADPSTSWVLYMDLDTAFTNFQIPLERVIGNVKEEASMVKDLQSTKEDMWTSTNQPSMVLSTDALCHDPSYPVNSGVVLSRGTIFTKRFVRLVVESQALTTLGLYGGRFLADQASLNVLLIQMFRFDFKILQRFCQEIQLKDQIPGTPKAHLLYSVARGNILIAHNRLMNSFWRKGENFEHDPEVAKWHRGDFIAHLTGMPESDRTMQWEKIEGIVAESKKDHPTKNEKLKLRSRTVLQKY